MMQQNRGAGGGAARGGQQPEVAGGERGEGAAARGVLRGPDPHVQLSSERGTTAQRAVSYLQWH